MLYVKDDWGVHGSSPFSLRYGFCLVEFSLLSRFEMSWIMSRRVIDLLTCWWSSERPRSVAIWKMAPICLFWCLWRERNNRSFEDLESTLKEILSSFYHTLYFWTSVNVHHLSFTFVDFLARFSLSN